jgi:GNAT superfamily N-acetyltransferase
MGTAIHYRRPEPINAQASGISVARVGSSDKHIVADICCNVFRLDDNVRALIANTADVPQWRQWIAYFDGEPIAAALSFVKDGVGWLGWDATLPEARGRGAQAALIAHRVSEAAACGCSYVTTETAVSTSVVTDPSNRNYGRAGFSLAYERATYVAMRSTPRPGANDGAKERT